MSPPEANPPPFPTQHLVVGWQFQTSMDTASTVSATCRPARKGASPPGELKAPSVDHALALPSVQMVGHSPENRSTPNISYNPELAPCGILWRSSCPAPARARGRASKSNSITRGAENKHPSSFKEAGMSVLLQKRVSGAANHAVIAILQRAADLSIG